MKENRVTAFIEAARTNQVIREGLQTAASPEDVVAIAAEQGFCFSLDELSSTEVELEQEDLSKITVRRAGFRVHPYGRKHWFGWKEST